MDSLRAPTVEVQGRVNPGAWMRFFGAAWYLAAGLAVAIQLASIPGYLSAPILGVFEGRLVISQDFTSQALLRLSFFLSFISGWVSVLLAGWLFVKKSSEPIGLFLAYYMLAHGLIFGGSIELLAWFWPAAPWVNSFILLPVFNGPMTMALIGTFPDGRFVPRWSLWLIPFSTLGALLTFFQLRFIEALEGPWQTDFSQVLTILFSIVLLGGSIYAQFYRYRRVSTPKQRRQTRWVLYGLALWFLVIGVSSVPWSRALALPEGALVPKSYLLGTVGWTFSSLFLPVTLAIAMLRERLLEIDIIINRSLVYSALTAIVAGVYVLIVGSLGVLFQSQDNLLISLLATGIVAVLFQPLREILQKRANRLMFGQRDDPVRVLGRLGEQIEANTALEELLHAILETVVESLKLPYAAIELEAGGKTRTAAAIGKPAATRVRLQLIGQGARLGALVVGERQPGEGFDPAEKHLLENIARQTGTAVRAGQLLGELQLSRRQIITAREEERRRLRRDLHDGIGPTMASQTLKLDAVLDLIEADSGSGSLAEARLILQQLKAQSQETVKTIRQIVYALRPPALDNLGLAQALRAYIEQHNRAQETLEISLEMDTGPADMPAAVEVAVYHIALEAVSNAVKHSGASRCNVRVAIPAENPGEIVLEIRDDGRGLPHGHDPGVGLAAMRERAQELGGRFRIDSGPSGTHVRAALPLPQEHPA